MAETPDSPVAEVRESGGATIVTLAGDVDMNRAPALRDSLTRIIAARPKRLVLTFGSVQYIDSTGLGTLVYMLRQVNAYKGKMLLVGLSPMVKSVFEVTKLLGVFNIHDSVDDALKA